MMHTLPEPLCTDGHCILMLGAYFCEPITFESQIQLSHLQFTPIHRGWALVHKASESQSKALTSTME